MKTATLCLLAILLALCATGVQAAVWNGVFPSTLSTKISAVPDYYASSGDKITQSFTGTGLDSVTALDLVFNVTNNLLRRSYVIGWDVTVNGSSVGTWTWTQALGAKSNPLSYSWITPIVGNGNYSIGMSVTTTAPFGGGSIGLVDAGTYKLTGTPHVPDNAVPEPATLLGFGLPMLMVGLGKLRGLRK